MQGTVVQKLSRGVTTTVSSGQGLPARSGSSACQAARGGAGGGAVSKRRRARMIPLAIDARRQRYPDETPYEYKGSYLGGGVWNEQARAEICKAGDEYWQRDITLRQGQRDPRSIESSRDSANPVVRLPAA